MLSAPVQDQRGRMEVNRLSKTYGRGVVALDDVTMELRRGFVCALVGPNGAGKSTLARILAGLTSPDAGSLLIEGNQADPGRHVAYCPQELTLPLWLSAIDILSIGKKGSLDKVRFVEALKAMSMEVTRQPFGRLSGGQRRAATIAYTLALSRPFIVMDEPFAGLDPQTAMSVVELVRRRVVDASVLVTSHQLEEIREVSDTAVLLHKGQVVETLDTIANLRTRRVLDFGDSNANHRAVKYLDEYGLMLTLDNDRVMTPAITSDELRELLTKASHADLVAIAVHDAAHD